MSLRRSLLVLFVYTLNEVCRTLLPRIKPENPPDPDSYWQVDLTPPLRFALLDLVRGKKTPPSSVLKALETAVMAAREMDLPREVLDWAELEDEAERQGVDIMDVWFDKTASTR